MKYRQSGLLATLQVMTELLSSCVCCHAQHVSCDFDHLWNYF